MNYTKNDLYSISLFWYLESTDSAKGSHILSLYKANDNYANTKIVSLLTKHPSVELSNLKSLNKDSRGLEIKMMFV